MKDNKQNADISFVFLKENYFFKEKFSLYSLHADGQTVLLAERSGAFAIDNSWLNYEKEFNVFPPMKYVKYSISQQLYLMNNDLSLYLLCLSAPSWGAIDEDDLRGIDEAGAKEWKDILITVGLFIRDTELHDHREDRGLVHVTGSWCQWYYESQSGIW